ncbi:hypothetical protein HMPREF9176_0925 [Streptococcus downei F0415]|nr:hypothetical protein HMPREF9176_0925 [Streptococcus downei F0415]
MILVRNYSSKGEKMYELGSHVEMKKPHACTIKATGKKSE